MLTHKPIVSPPFVPKEPQLKWGDLPWPYSPKRIPGPVQNGKIFHFQQARYALFHGIRMLGFRSGDKILVPAFHCSTLIESVLRTGVNTRFYNVKTNLILDFEDLERKVDGKTKGLLIVHYFGVLQPMDLIQQFCKEKGLRLIEDCAHIFKGKYHDQDLGTFGDFSVFSWRKFFPIPSGGTLVVPREYSQEIPPFQKYSILQNLKDIKWGLGQCLESSHKSSLPLESVPGLQRSDAVADFDGRISSIKGSWFPLNYLKQCDLNYVSKVRESNWKFMASALNETSTFLSSWGKIWENAVAWAFPLLIVRGNNFHIELRNRGIPAFTWGGVIHPGLDLKEFPDAEFLYSKLVLLPIHQDLHPHALEYIAETVRALMKKL